MVQRFEALCAAMAGTPFAVAMSNGTVTLEAILECVGLHPGDELVTSPFTFGATLNAALRSGATVRFADIGADFTLDPDAVAVAVSPRTRAVVPVHLYGLMAPMEALQELAERAGLVLIEDAAQAHGARCGGRRAGSIGIGSFSFYATKNVTAAEGGAVTTHDPVLADRLRMLRNQGMASRYHYEVIGRNLRLSELHAAVAVPQLEQLALINSARAANAARLTEALRAEPAITVPQSPPDRVHVWHQYTVLLPDGVDRDAIVARMRDDGVGTGIYYPQLVWDHPAYRGHPNVVPGDTPNASRAADRCLSLPVHQGLGPDEIERVAATTLTALSEVG
jgi:dTDP-4-amino-4,6-dideoxygalactose transaminase